MIILENSHPIIEEQLKSALNPEYDRSRNSFFSRPKESLDVKFCDFGQTRYSLRHSEDCSLLLLSISIPGINGLLSLGLMEQLSNILPSGVSISPKPQESFDVTLNIVSSSLAPGSSVTVLSPY